MKARKAVVLSLLFLFLLLVPNTVFAQGLFTAFVIAGADDVKHHLQPIHVFGTVDGFVHAGDRSVTEWDNESALRFQNVTIVQGATILTAILRLRAQSSTGAAWNTFIEGEDNDDASSIPVDFDWHDARPRTTARVVWTPAAWVATTIYSSPDISAVIQEIIDRPGWVSGNNIILYWGDNQGTGFQVNRRLRADAFEWGGGTPAELIVTSEFIPASVRTVLEGWVRFLGIGLSILFVALFCGVALWLVKAPPIMMLICGFISMLILWQLEVISAILILIVIVLFTAAILFKILFSSGGSGEA